MNGNYQPRSVQRVMIPKPKGKGERKLDVPCVIDRVIQQAMLQVLSPIFEHSMGNAARLPVVSVIGNHPPERSR